MAASILMPNSVSFTRHNSDASRAPTDCPRKVTPSAGPMHEVIISRETFEAALPPEAVELVGHGVHLGDEGVEVGARLDDRRRETGGVEAEPEDRLRDAAWALGHLLDHTDAVIQALEDSGLRAVFAYGFPWWCKWEER